MVGITRQFVTLCLILAVNLRFNTTAKETFSRLLMVGFNITKLNYVSIVVGYRLGPVPVKFNVLTEPGLKFHDCVITVPAF